MKTPAITEATTSALNSLDITPPTRWTPRQSRAIDALVAGAVMRETLDRVVGCSNSPEVVRQLREMGISIDCEMVEHRDRDGKVCRPGRYSLTNKGRKALMHRGLL